ncbi:MAG: MerC domain-containing protein [Cyclobacteriaceae bacterium]|nr:MerC domain-containing protein [Cyclobacteriaceae bacterium]
MNLDLVGFSVSLLCAVHCAALPFLLSLAPLAGLHYLNNPWIEYAIILLSFCIASYALIHGYRRHHQKPLALVIVVVGFILIGTGHLIQSEWKEITLTSVGAVVVAMAHFINWEQVKKSHVEFPDCIHQQNKSK